MLFQTLFVLTLVLFKSIVGQPTDETIGSINGHIDIEREGIQLNDDPIVIPINSEFTAKVVIPNQNQLKNVSYSWFVNDLEFKSSPNKELVYRFETPKEYKLMAVVLAKDCKQNESCFPKFGIIWRKVVAIQNHSILTEILSEANIRAKKRISDKDYYSIYGALIIGGAILMTLIFISIVIHTITLCDKNGRSDRYESKIPLIDKRHSNKYPMYTMP